MSDQETSPSTGVPLVRGPMGGDQEIGVFQDPQLSAKAKGIFGFLSTQPDGWRADVKSIVREMRDGRDAIITGLQELEHHHYLIRHHARRQDGRWGESAWFYTDLPAQLRAEGVADQAVADRVQAEFERWQGSPTGLDEREVAQ